MGTTMPKSAPAQGAAPPAGPNVPRYLQGVASAEVRPVQEYIRPGEYTLKVTAVRQFTSRKSIPFLVVEVQVEHVHFQDVDAATGKPLSNRQGQSVAWMVNFTTDGAQRDVVSFLNAVCTAEELDALSDNWVNEAAAPEGDGKDSVLVGRRVYCTARNVQTRKGTTFTQVRWSPFVGSAITEG